MKRLFNAFIVASLVGIPLSMPLDASAQESDAKTDPLFAVLNESQKKSVGNILNSSRSRTKPLFAKIKAFSDSHKNAKTLSASDQKVWNGLMSQLKAEQQANKRKVLALLSPAQKAKLQAAAKQQSTQ